MKTESIVGLIVTTVVAIIIIGSLLAPVVSSVSGEQTYTNDGYRMSAVGSDTVTISYADSNWNVNGTDIGIGNMPISQGTVMVYGLNDTRAGFLYTNGDSYSRNSIALADETTIEYVGETKTVNITTTLASNSTTYTSSYTYLDEVYYYDSEGDYVWQSSYTEGIYVPDNWTPFNCWSVDATHFYAILGSIDTILVDAEENPDGVTYSLELNDVDGVSGVKTIGTYTLNISDEDPITCRGFIIPYEVTGEKENTMLYSAVVIVFLMAIVMIGARAITHNKD